MTNEQFMSFGEPSLAQWVDQGTDKPATIGGLSATEHERQVGQSWSAPDGAISVELPSGFRFYDFKEIYVSPFKGKHLGKITAAAKAKSARILAEAVSSTLFIPGRTKESGIAFELTLPDYFWLLYFHRKTWYTNTSYNVTTRCHDTLHIQKVMSGELKPETLVLRSRVDTATLRETKLENVPPLPQCLADLEFSPPTVSDLIMTLEDENFGKPEHEFAFEMAPWLGRSKTWADRLAMVDDLTIEQIEAVRALEKPLSDYGVEEVATIKCKECGASNETILSIDASAFLPSS